MKHRLLTFAIVLAALALGAGPVHAQRIKPGMNANIVAVVNDNVISSADLNARMAMAFLSSGLPDTPEVRQHLAVQLLRNMIDEQLELQEAKKNDITVTDSEVDSALARIAQGNNVPGGDMKQFLRSHGIPPEVLVNQIRASLAWNKVIQRELRPRVDIGDDEVDAVLERTKANVGKQEYLVSDIFLSVDNPRDDEQVHKFAENLVQKLRQGGNFSAIARQFSQSTSAAAGGDIGWIGEGQLAPELNKALGSLHPNEITNPIRAGAGYYIIGLREKRTVAMDTDVAKHTLVQMQQAYRPFAANGDKAAILKEAAKLQSSISGCDNLKDRLAKQFPAWKWLDLGVVTLADAPAWLAAKARDLPVGKPSEAMEVNQGALVLFVCNRKTPEGKIDRDAITDQIGTEKLELQARGLLRDLRRDAYLDVRLGKG
jgi:peptidyl-prolyl cis-trans isomerase SurA